MVMTTEEAKEFLSKYEIEFEIEDSALGDGSCTVSYKYLLDSQNEAKSFVEAVSELLNNASL